MLSLPLWRAPALSSLTIVGQCRSPAWTVVTTLLLSQSTAVLRARAQEPLACEPKSKPENTEPGGLLGEYWTSAVPSRAKPELQMFRRDAKVDFDWTTPPGLPAAPQGGLGFVWTGYLQPPVTGAYSFVLDTYTPASGVVSFSNHTRIDISSKRTEAPLEFWLDADHAYYLYVQYWWFCDQPQVSLLWSYRELGEEEWGPTEVIPSNVLWSVPKDQETHNLNKDVLDESLPVAVKISMPPISAVEHLWFKVEVHNFSIPGNGMLKIQCDTQLITELWVSIAKHNPMVYNMPIPVWNDGISEWKSCTAQLFRNDGRMVATDTADFFVVVESDQASYKGFFANEVEKKSPEFELVAMAPVPSLRRQLLDNGYAVLRSVFDDQSIEQWWAMAEQWFGTQKPAKNSAERYKEGGNNTDEMKLGDGVLVYEAEGVTALDCFNVPELLPIVNSIFASERLLTDLREMFGGDELLYGHSSFLQFNQSQVMWHTDLIDVNRLENDPWCGATTTAAAGEYEVVKVIIYMQDHSTDPFGLTVLPGSHLHRKRGFHAIEPVTINSAVGDVVIFDKRLLHRGAAWMYNQSIGRRANVAFTVGPPNKHTRDDMRARQAQIERNSKRSYAIQDHLRAVLDGARVLY